DTIITTCLIDDLDFSMQRDSTNVSFETSYFLDTTEYQIIWDFGDSTSISNQNNPTNFYNYYGYKTITLSVVYLPDGTCNNQIQKTLNVDSIPCIQSAEIVIYENVYKHAIFELLPNVDTVNYNILWNLGDGITIENQYLINHIFPYTNIYDVTCQLSHKADSNCILIIEKEIDLECYNDIGFDYEIDYDTWQYGWNALVWAYEVYNEPPNSYALNCNCGTGGTGYTMNNHWHWNCLYTNVGNYPISLTVYDLEDSTCFGSYGPINITIEEPECDVYAAIGNVFLFEYDSMTVIVQGGGNPDFSYNWTFGDGTSGGGYEEWHTYADYGVYEICLTAINNLGVGCSETDCEYFTLGTPGCNDTLALNYNPNADFNNGSCIYSGTQSISLPQGWSIFSTYIEPYENNIDSVFQEIVGNTVLVKNQIGLVYYPQYSITLLDTLALGQGYQVKMSSGDTLSVTGIICQPQNSPITLQAGWSIIGYLRQIPADISQMFSDITQNTEIVKDELGNVYWPQYSVNNIGNMLPGKGYQVKMNVGDVLNY
ncbi:MAG: PKD domain-containing protein, partial [Bacteroidetes bacterium]|nr:PKD domain-containing protein [Bacteroidota bacterium]